MKADLIDREYIVNNIVALIKNLGKGEHFCLALDGEWGSGKSFVVDMLEEKIKVNVEYFVVKYDAWENSFYADPLIAILYCILDGLKDKFHYIKGKKEIVEAVEEVGANAVKVVNKIAEIADPTGTVKKVLDLISVVTKGICKSIKAFKFDKSDNPRIKDFKSYKTLLNEVKDNLNKLTDFQVYEGKQTKLIILVDEIDRCLPDEQLKILERLHHILDVRNCFVLCSLNKNSVVKSIKCNYDVDGAEYLRKFFDRSLRIEPATPTYFQKCFENKIDKYAESNNIPFNEQQKQEIIQFINFLLIENAGNKTLLQDNREVTRFFDRVIEILKNLNTVTDINEICVVFIIAFLKNYDPQHYHSDTQNCGGRTYIAPLDFIEGYIPAAHNLVKNQCPLFATQYINNYKYFFLNYYNLALNYFNFEKVIEIQYKRTNLQYGEDDFIKSLPDVLKKVETYG